MNKSYEKPDLCKTCGGKCCLEAPCILDVSDLKDVSASGIVSAVKERNLSVQGLVLANAYESMDYFTFPYLYLSSKVADGNEVDFLALEGKCANLEPNGCKFDSTLRPKGGRDLIPTKNFRCHYKSKDALLNIIASWKYVQDELKEATEIMTGSNVSSDIEFLYSDIFKHPEKYKGDKTLNSREFTLSYLYCAIVNGFGVKMSPDMAVFINELVNKHPEYADCIIESVRNLSHQFYDEESMKIELARRFY